MSSGDHWYLLHKQRKNSWENLRNFINVLYPKPFWGEKSHFYDSLIVRKQVVCEKVVQHQEWLMQANCCAEHRAVIYHGYPGRWRKVQLFWGTVDPVYFFILTVFQMCFFPIFVQTNKKQLGGFIQFWNIAFVIKKLTAGPGSSREGWNVMSVTGPLPGSRSAQKLSCFDPVVLLNWGGCRFWSGIAIFVPLPVCVRWFPWNVVYFSGEGTFGGFGWELALENNS